MHERGCDEGCDADLKSYFDEYANAKEDANAIEDASANEDANARQRRRQRFGI